MEVRNRFITHGKQKQNGKFDTKIFCIHRNHIIYRGQRQIILNNFSLLLFLTTFVIALQYLYGKVRVSYAYKGEAP